MISYYGYTISPNQIETGEGFLICRNVPVARTGTQEYLGREIGLTGADADRVITVCRSSDEVFAQEALASFEGKPVTNDHPPDLIGPEDVNLYEMGHAQNVRRGSGEREDYMVADLHIHARELIDAIQAGKREISCGYECEYTDNGDGTYSQKRIRGNHIAVVDRGRAGKLAAILDSNKAVAESKTKQAEKRPERKKMKKNSLLLKLFGQAVKDKSPEEIEQMAMDAADALEGVDGEPGDGDGQKGDPGEPGKGKGEAPAIDESVIDGLVDKVIEKMAARKAAESKNPLDDMIEKLTGGEGQIPAGTGEESHVVPAEEMDKTGCGLDQSNPSMDKALAASILKTMRPVVAAIKDEGQRQAVTDALIQCVTVRDKGDGDISKILDAVQNNAKAAVKKQPSMDQESIQKAYDRMNPHSSSYEKKEEN